MYCHISKFRPESDLSKWLEGFDKNFVIDFTDSFKKKILFRAPNEFFSQASLPILYSSQNKSAITIVGLDYSIASDTFCALLDAALEIVPFEQKIINSENKVFWTKCDEFQQFFVCDEKFVTIAYGTMSLYELSEKRTLVHMWEATNLRGWKKCFVTIRYFLTIVFVKYLKYITSLLDKWSIIWDEFDECVSSCEVCCDALTFLIQLSLLVPGWYIYRFFVFHTITLPFHVLAIFLEFFLFEKPFFSLLPYSALHASCFLSNSIFFPRILDNFLWRELVVKTFCKYKFEAKFKLSAFDIEPKNKMWSYLFLFPRNLPYYFINIFVFLIYEFLFSLVLKFAFKNWVPHSEYE
jgi:hypothetical protein